MVFTMGMGRKSRSSHWAALAVLALFASHGCTGDIGSPGGGTTAPPPFTGETGTILFVTQVPVAGFTCVTSTFANHEGSVTAAPRGGDLMIRYPDGTLRNLTREAGFGMTGLQGDKAIAVRQPSVHWDGKKAVFSMVVGSPEQFDYNQYRWQLYEVTGLGKNEPVSITLVPRQPAEYNNIAPTYATDDRIIFASDRPRDGEAHLYPQLDEYESAPTVTGLWSLDPVGGDLRILNHAPSGVFSPSVDSFGRVIFTKWDHLQRDQQADAERLEPGRYGAFTYADESAGAARDGSLVGAEVFPEPRAEADPDTLANVALHTYNQFLPWEVNEDGSGEETLNHVGRHELGGSYIFGSFKDDPNLTDVIPPTHANRYDVRGDGGLFYLREDPKHPGTYYATFASEFGTAGAGALLKFAGEPSRNPEAIELLEVTSRASYLQPESPSGAPDSTGHYRNPLPMSDGNLIASHTSEVRGAKNNGTRAAPAWNYAFRLKVLKPDGALVTAGATLTEGIPADISYFDPDVRVSYSGLLWELDAVEVAVRARPTPRVQPIEAPELSVFADTGVDVEALRAWLRDNDLALIISRNVTSRDRADVQQPFNLRVPGGVSTIAKTGTIYDVSFMQIFQGDAVRGYGGIDQPRSGRRLLARPMHGPAISPAPAGAAAGSVALGLDGSMAAFVPARRALSWQLTSPTNAAVVRERNWVSFQAGEIRTCAVCHGLNTVDQIGGGLPTNPPEALRTLLLEWVASQP